MFNLFAFYLLRNASWRFTIVNFPKTAHRLSSMERNYWSNPREIRIPVSYGFLAGKAWGRDDAEPVLAMHGWQDNSGTFDRLIPLLSSELFVVAFDGPGHGLSSHKPPGTFYHYMELLVDIKRVVDYLKWDRFSILGHSLGGTLALMYCSVFPEKIKNIILLDIAKPASRPAEELAGGTRKGIESLLSLESKIPRPAPVYTLEEARDRLIAGVYNEVTPESADILLKRGCRPSDCGKGVVFSRDIRVKGTEDLQKLSHIDLMAYLNNVRCNLMLIRGAQSKIFQSRHPKVVEECIALYKKNCSDFRLVEVDGNHFVHLNNPERVAPYIDEFLTNHECRRQTSKF